MRFVLAGELSVVDKDGTVHGVAGSQRRACLALLVLERPRPVGSHEIAELLWGEVRSAHWQGAVRGVVAKVRSSLVELGLPASAFVTQRGSVRLELPPSATVDLEEAAAAVAEAEAALADRRFADGLAAAESARALLVGQLLPGTEGAWVDGRRHDMAADARWATHAATSCHLGIGQSTPAIALALASVRSDPFDETGHRLLMRAHAAAGERGAALAAYEGCRALLDDELGVRPSSATEALGEAAEGNSHIPCYRAVLALCCAESGHRADAEMAYKDFAASAFAAIPEDPNRLLTLAVLADVAATLGDVEGGATLAALLGPHAERYVVHNCFGGGGATWGPG